jgi:hypothetical protein
MCIVDVVVEFHIPSIVSLLETYICFCCYMQWFFVVLIKGEVEMWW